MPISIHTQSREDNNNRAMLAPPTRTTSGVTLRPISLGSLEILRQLNNSLATAEADMGEIDTRTLTEFLWVHGAPIDEVLDTVYNYPTQIGLKATAFAMSISPAELRVFTSSLVADRAAIQSASAEPIPDPDSPTSPNAHAAWISEGTNTDWRNASEEEAGEAAALYNRLKHLTRHG